MSKSNFLITATTHRYRAQKHGLVEHFTAEEWESKLIDSGYKCVNCGSGDKLTADHIVPLSLSGTNKIANIQVLCKSCNSKKPNRLNGAPPVRRKSVVIGFTPKSSLVDPSVNHDVMLTVHSVINALEKNNRRRYTDNEIAKATGLHRQTIATLRKGKPEPTIAKLLDYFRSEGLPVTVADLFTVE